ncbi:MAG: PhzF family phenazine biosynthesis protein, partial [Acidimicrobiales bacterium]
MDAFCEGPFTGNPAAVCLLAGPGPDLGMQALARELSLSETAFTWPEGEAFGLRWFTPVSEVELCGHATVATAHALAHAGRLDDGHARFSTKSGWLEATVDGEQVEIDLPAETPVPVDPPPEFAAHWPVVRAAAGRFDLLVELESEDAVRRRDPEAVDLAALRCRRSPLSRRLGHRERERSSGPVSSPTAKRSGSHRSKPTVAVIGVPAAYSSIWGAAHWQKPLSSPHHKVSRHTAG